MTQNESNAPTDAPNALPNTANAPRKRGRWLLPIVLLTVLIGLIVFGAAWATRPRWRTYTSPAQKETGVAFVMDYPEGWKLEGNPSAREMEAMGFVMVTFQRPPPTGLNRWWYEKILHQNMEGWRNNRISGTLFSRSAPFANIEALERLYRRYSNRLTVRRVRHALGPALEMEQHITLPTGANSGVGGTALYSLGIMIFPEDAPAHRKICLSFGVSSMAGQEAQMRALFDEVVGRVRLVDRK